MSVNAQNKYSFKSVPVDLTALEPAIYIVDVKFQPAGPMNSYRIRDTFSELLVLDLEERVNDLNAQLQLVDANIAALWDADAQNGLQSET